MVSSRGVERRYSTSFVEFQPEDHISGRWHAGWDHCGDIDHDTESALIGGASICGDTGYEGQAYREKAARRRRATHQGSVGDQGRRVSDDRAVCSATPRVGVGNDV